MENILGISKRTIAITALLLLCTIVLAASVSLFKSNAEHQNNERCRTIQQTLTSRASIKSTVTIGDDGVPIVEVSGLKSMYSDESTFLEDTIDRIISVCPEDEYVIKVHGGIVIFSYDSRTNSYRISGTDDFMKNAVFTTQDESQFYDMKDSVAKCYYDYKEYLIFRGYRLDMNHEAAIKLFAKRQEKEPGYVDAQIGGFELIKNIGTFNDIENYERRFDDKDSLL